MSSRPTTFKYIRMSVIAHVDITSEYHHAPLDRPSQLLTTFNSLPYCGGIALNPSAEELVFTKKFEKSLEDLDIDNYFDDSIAASTTQADHDKTFSAFLRNARDYNIGVNRKKTQHNLSEPGLRKVQAINEMSNPEGSTKITENNAASTVQFDPASNI